MVLGEDAHLIDITGELKNEHFSMNFMTVVKPGIAAFYEMNHHTDSKRMVVIVFNADWKAKKK